MGPVPVLQQEAGSDRLVAIAGNRHVIATRSDELCKLIGLIPDEIDHVADVLRDSGYVASRVLVAKRRRISYQDDRETVRRPSPATCCQELLGDGSPADLATSLPSVRLRRATPGAAR